MLIGVLILKESSLHYLQRNVDFLSYIAGGSVGIGLGLGLGRDLDGTGRDLDNEFVIS